MLGGGGTAMNAIKMLKKQHREVEALLKELEKAAGGHGAPEQGRRRSIVAGRQKTRSCSMPSPI